MPVQNIGYPGASGQTSKVLRSSEYGKEINGLETLSETYTIRTQNRITLQPARNVLHTSFSTASTRYSRMAVETVSMRDLPGELTEMTVGFVGLTSSTGLPPPVIRLLPVTNQIHIEAEYISDAGEDFFTTIAATTRMPDSINGYQMPNNPPQVTTIQSYAGSVRNLGYCYDQTSCIRRGSFLVVRATFRKKVQGSGVYASVTDI